MGENLLLKTTEVVPDAAAMIEGFRAMGYSFEMAVADIIDNSISAEARNIWIDFDWNNENPWIAIRDDGKGMNDEELIEAMRPGSKNPLSERSKADLGRFGMGLKTASFSQCKSLTVMSKTNTANLSHWTWDLEHIQAVKKWELIKKTLPLQFERYLDTAPHGTVVIWEKLDRFGLIEGKPQINLEKFLEKIESLKKHVMMTFHRFIESKKIQVSLQQRLLGGWDPFLSELPGAQSFPEENISNTEIKLKGYVLPHRSRITEEQYRLAEGVKGWTGQQGFYIYRNDRLILYGDWLGLFRKEEHYKLARIQIDLNNQYDHDWQIDIKKCTTSPPIWAKEQLRAYAMNVRNTAVAVYRHRGKNVKVYPKQKFIPFWIEHKRGDKWYHKINREHPLIESTLLDQNSETINKVEKLLRFIEETIPGRAIFIKEVESPESLAGPFESTDQTLLKKTMREIYLSLLNEMTPDDAKARLLNIEPFNHFPHFFEFIES